MRRVRPWVLALSLWVGAAGVAIPSSAEPAPPSPRKAAPLDARPSGQPQEDFDAGQRLFDEGKHAEALARFRRAYEITGSPNAHLMLARALVALGNTPAAYEEMAATLREATARAEREPRYIQTRDAAAAELAMLERRVGKVIIVLVEAGTDAQVELNGAKLRPSRLGLPVAVEPGSLVVSASRPGKGAVRRYVAVRAGETKTLAISFAEEAGPRRDEPVAARGEGALAPRAPARAAAPARGEGGGVLRALGYGTAGVGVAGIVAFGVAGSMADGKYAELQRACGQDRCKDPKLASVVDTGKALDTVANVGLAVGVAGLVAGGAMILLGAPRRDAAAQVGFGVTPSGVRLGYSAEF